MNLSPRQQWFLRTAVALVVALLMLAWWRGAPSQGSSLPPLQATASAATPSPTVDVSKATPLPGAPVEVGGEVLFYVRERLGSLPPAERAALISKRINDLATNPFAPAVELQLAESDDGTDIMAGDEILLTVTDRDAAAVGLDRQVAANRVAGAIQEAIMRTRQQYTPQARAVRALEVLGILAVLVLALYLLNLLFRRMGRSIDALPTEEGRIPVLGRTTLYRSGGWKRTLKHLLSLLRVVVFLAVIFFVAPVVLSLIPATAKVAKQLLALVFAPLEAMWAWVVDYESSLITVLVIVLVTYLLYRIVHFFFREISQGTIRLGGFDPEWAPFTGKIVSFLLIIGAVIITFPYLPGSDSEAFRGISVFLGILFTLSSTAAVANVVAGVIQTYTGAFRVGDVVKIGETTGFVTEKRLLTTRVRTFKNEEVSLPNGMVLNANVVNYTTMARGEGLVLYTTVTIGYDVPWRQVQDLLIAAALATPDILPEPAPFVLQTSLNDYHISYQLNCWTRNPERMPRLYSGLHQNIQDKFNQAGVEIMSPAFSALRDGNTVTIPAGHRPDGYEPPSFRIGQSGQNAGSQPGRQLDEH